MTIRWVLLRRVPQWKGEAGRESNEAGNRNPFVVCKKVGLTLTLQRNLTSWMQSQEATLGGVLSIQTQLVGKCLAWSGDCSRGWRMLPTPSWALCRRASTQPNAGPEQARSLSSMGFLNEKARFKQHKVVTSTYLAWEGSGVEGVWWFWRNTWGLISPHTFFFHSKLFSFWGCYDWNVQIHEFGFFSFLFPWTSSLSCFLHQRILQNNCLCMFLLFCVSKYMHAPSSTHTYITYIKTSITYIKTIKPISLSSLSCCTHCLVHLHAWIRDQLIHIGTGSTVHTWKKKKSLSSAKIGHLARARGSAPSNLV